MPMLRSRLLTTMTDDYGQGIYDPRFQTKVDRLSEFINVVRVHPRQSQGVRKVNRRPSKEKRKKVARLAELFGWYCHWCGCELSYAATWANEETDPPRYPTLDHLVEIGEGGNNNIGNLVLSCQPCNNHRSNPSKKRKKG